MEIIVNTPFEVNENQYKLLIPQFDGVIAHREENGKYYIKVMISKYIPIIKQILGWN